MPYRQRSPSELTALISSEALTGSGVPEAVVAAVALGGADANALVAERLLSGQLPVLPDDLPQLAGALGVEEQRVVITRHGKPVCILIGCEGYEIDEVLTAADPAFWKMIEERRARGRSRSLASVRRHFARKDTASAPDRRFKP